MAYAPLVLWIGVIFFLSSDQGSVSSTSRFIRPLLVFLFPGSPEETLQIYHGYVRKAAHFAEYGFLAFLAGRAFYSTPRLRTYWAVLAIAVVVFIACADEFNQSFSLERTSSGYDVLIDICGGAVTIGFALVIGGWSKRQNSPS